MIVNDLCDFHDLYTFTLFNVCYVFYYYYCCCYYYYYYYHYYYYYYQGPGLSGFTRERYVLRAVRK